MHSFFHLLPSLNLEEKISPNISLSNNKNILQENFRKKGNEVYLVFKTFLLSSVSNGSHLRKSNIHRSRIKRKKNGRLGKEEVQAEYSSFFLNKIPQRYSFLLKTTFHITHLFPLFPFLVLFIPTGEESSQSLSDRKNKKLFCETQ